MKRNVLKEINCQHCGKDCSPWKGYSVQELVRPESLDPSSQAPSVLAHYGVCTDTLIASGKWELLVV